MELKESVMTEETPVSDSSELDNLDLSELTIGYDDDGELQLIKSTPIGQKKAEPVQAKEEAESVDDVDDIDDVNSAKLEDQREFTQQSQTISELKKEIEDLKYLIYMTATRGNQQATPPEEEEDLLAILSDKRGKPYIQNEVAQAVKPVFQTMKDVVENLQIKDEFDRCKDQYGEDFVKLIPQINRVFDEKPYFTFEDAYLHLRGRNQGNKGSNKDNAAVAPKPTLAEIRQKQARYEAPVQGEAQVSGQAEEVNSIKAAMMLARKQLADGRY
jgi:hypothetical protein